MTLSFRDRSRRRGSTRHDPTHHDSTHHDSRPSPTPGVDATLAERLVRQASGLFATRQSRRSFLAKTAVVGSVLAVDPLGYILRPGTAYGALCGTCSDGWTAFCCTINGGRNSCPAGSFVAGWWKADNAAFCCGAARYIIDCNASCPTQCSCRCSGASCDGRRVCCNQFRYGQCHQEIACYGPVVCRVATCTPPWQYDRSCTATSATDNRTVTHGAPCLPDQCGPPPTPIAQLYAFLGGAQGGLGPVTTTERATVDRSGRYAKYTNGLIFQRNGKAPHFMVGAIAQRYSQLDYHRSELEYPASNEASFGDAAGGRYTRFEGGVIYASNDFGTREVLGPIRKVHSTTGGVHGPLGYPVAPPYPDGTAGRHQRFEHGSIWQGNATGTRWLYGVISARYITIGTVGSALGWPTGNHTGLPGGSLSRFDGGSIYATGTSTFVLTGPVSGKYRAVGETRGALGWPVGEPHALGDGVECRFVRGGIYYRPGRQNVEVHGVIDGKWREYRGTTGPLGWPTADTATLPDGRGRWSTFEQGAVYFQPSVGTWEVHGPIFDRYVQLGATTGSLGYPRSDVYQDGSLLVCDFERGRLTYDPDTGEVTEG